MTDQKEKLIHAAIEARNYAYVPYSGFTVGAALLTAEDEIFQGSNIENISFSATMCAERTAIFSAIAKGHRDFRAIAVSGGKKDMDPVDYCIPCAVCLQVMSEFCDPEFEILIVKSEDDVRHYRLKDLLPVTFDSLK